MGLSRSHSPFKNNNKLPRLSTDPKYLSKVAYYIFLTPLIFIYFFSTFSLKVGMLYNIFEAFHPSPSTKGTLFSKITLRKNHNGKIGCSHVLD